MPNVRNADGLWINTEVFREQARHFERKGYYTDAPWGSPAWMEFWLNEEKKCKNGVTIGGASITGFHYFYLNYCPINRTGEQKKGVARKKLGFPDFYDGDYDYTHILEIAKHGITPPDLKKLHLYNDPLNLDGGKHLLVTKRRRAGFSFKNSALAVHEYTFYRGSYSLLGAYESKYLYPKGTMTMATALMDFLNQHTGFRRQRGTLDRRDHVRASFWRYLDGVKIEQGYKSEVQAISFKDKPDAGKGKDITLAIFEEVGVWPHFIQAWSATRPALEDGSLVTGRAIAFGTGGNMDTGSADFYTLAYDPGSWGFMEFKNIYDDGMEGNSCYFFSGTQNIVGFMDEHGNSNHEAAKQAEEEHREKLSKRPNGAMAIALRVQEYPLNLTEAFLVKSGNDFPTMALQRQLGLLRGGDQSLANKGQVFNLHYEGDQVVASPDLSGRQRVIDEYPYKGDDVSGAIVIYEHPPARPPAGAYVIGYDPYRFSTAETSFSLGAIFVYKRERVGKPTDNLIVAEYVGRPSTQDGCDYIAELLAEYYNAEIMHENEVTNVITNFTKRHKLHRLADSPTSVINANVDNSRASRGKGVHMPPKIKDAAERYLKAWLMEVRDDGTSNIDYIYSKGLIQELLRYTRKGNFDRVSALFCVMLALENKKLAESQEDKPTHHERLDALAEHLANRYAA